MVGMNFVLTASVDAAGEFITKSGTDMAVSIFQMHVANFLCFSSFTVGKLFRFQYQCWHIQNVPAQNDPSSQCVCVSMYVCSHVVPRHPFTRSSKLQPYANVNERGVYQCGPDQTTRDHEERGAL